VLSFAAGATDAFAFLLLGGVFTANMTGNLVLAGLTQRPGYPSMIVWIAVAVVAFVLTSYAALRMTRAPGSRRRLLGALLLGTTAQAGVLVGWIALPHPMDGLLPAAVLLALSAAAMAIQTAVSKRIEGRSGVTTTYVTGTITSIAADLADRVPQDLPTRLGVLGALVLGALCGSLAMAVDPVWAAALPILPAAIAAVLLATGHPVAPAAPHPESLPSARLRQGEPDDPHP